MPHPSQTHKTLYPTYASKLLTQKPLLHSQETGQAEECSSRQAECSFEAPLDAGRVQGSLRGCERNGPIGFGIRTKTHWEVTPWKAQRKNREGSAVKAPSTCHTHNSRNWWKFSVGGRPIQQSANTEKKREAQDFLKNEILKYANGDAVPTGKVTVDSLYDVLLADYRINGKAIEWAERVRNIHLKAFFGGTQAKNVGTETLSRYIEMRLKAKAANATINRELSLLQRSFMLGYESQPRKVARPLRFHRLAEVQASTGIH
jgi:hypothetical protein